MTDHGPTTDDSAEELLRYAEEKLARATMRLGRLRSRNRGTSLHRELTTITYDLQAARHAVAALLEEEPPRQ